MMCLGGYCAYSTIRPQANGDIFGRIYEYFLTGFADLKAHDGGEFFTPVSLVQMIVNVIEPDHGTVATRQSCSPKGDGRLMRYRIAPREKSLEAMPRGLCSCHLQ